jgi:hypothetical protein
MKKIFYLILTLPIIFASCNKNDEVIPVAHFFTDTVTPEVGHEVLFTNDSQNSSLFEWDFGDGYISNDANPVHVYTGTGTYEVTLTATSVTGIEDKATLLIDVLIPTLLEIEVLEYYDEYPVADASVRLYPSIADWDAEKNMVDEGFTDKDGFVVFSGLEPFGYYVDVWEKNHDNYQLRDEDYQLYIRTPDIKPNKINRFIAWVDYYPDKGKGAVRGDNRMIIKKLEKVRSFKRQASTGSDTEGWQELYDRSVKKK